MRVPDEILPNNSGEIIGHFTTNSPVSALKKYHILIDLFALKAVTNITFPNVCYSSKKSRIVIEVLILYSLMNNVYLFLAFCSYGNTLWESMCWPIMQHCTDRTATPFMETTMNCKGVNVEQRVSMAISTMCRTQPLSLHSLTHILLTNITLSFYNLYSLRPGGYIWGDCEHQC